MNIPATYMIRIRGHLDPEWSDWLGDMALTPNEDGTSTLTGVMVDQAALYGMLDKLRDLGLQLLAVTPLPGDKE